MKTSYKILTSVALLTLLTACGGKKDALVAIECAHKDAPEIPAPAWICNRVHAGMEASAVGFSEKLAAGPSLTETIATTNARVKLAKEIGVQVNNMVKAYIENTGLGKDQSVDRVYTSITKEITGERLVGAKVIKVTQSPKGGTYVLMGMNASSVKNAATAAIKSSMNKESALWQQFKAKKGQDELAAGIVDYKK